MICVGNILNDYIKPLMVNSAKWRDNIFLSLEIMIYIGTLSAAGLFVRSEWKDSSEDLVSSMFLASPTLSLNGQHSTFWHNKIIQPFRNYKEFEKNSPLVLSMYVRLFLSCPSSIKEFFHLLCRNKQFMDLWTGRHQEWRAFKNRVPAV